MNAETRPERRPLRELPQAEKSLPAEQVPQAQGWLDMARTQLARPEATEWKEGHSYMRDEIGGRIQKVSTSERFIALEDKNSQRSIVINDGPELGGKYRRTNIIIADLPEKGSDYVKRERIIQLVHDEQGKLISAKANDTSKYEDKSFGTGFTREGWESGHFVAIGTLEQNYLSPTELQVVMDEITSQIEKAEVNKEFSTKVRDHAAWYDEFAYATWQLANEAIPSGDKKRIAEARARVEEVKKKAPGGYKEPEKKKDEEKSKDNASKSQESTLTTRGIIPAYMLKDRDFSVIYEALIVEMTDNGKKTVSQEEIDKRFLEEYPTRKEALVKSALQDASVKEPVGV